MRAHRFTAAVLTTLALTGATLTVAPAAGAASPAAVLRARIVAALAGSTAALTGAAVAADGLGPAVDVNGSLPLPPASTQKLYTAGAALAALGPAYRLRTEVRATADVGPDGTLPGDLVLVGGGDPTLVGDDLQRLAFAVAGAGITHVTGGLYADDSRYDRTRGAPGWKPRFVPEETGPLSALVVDRNAWRGDPAFLADPTPANADRFRIALSRAGVTVDGPTAEGPSPNGPGSPVASHDSPPLGALLGPMVLKDSDNFVAEQLLKEVGTTIGAPTTNGGIEVAWRLAEGFGIGRGQSADGSGLSMHDRETPWHEVGWLVHFGDTPWADWLRLSLPLACGDGTLQQRFCATPAAGRVFAKTGTLPGTSSLAGYTTTASGRRAWFAFELAGVVSTDAARDAIDRAVLAIVTFEQ